MGECVLRVENISKSFGPTRANRNICISVERGEVRGLTGENGSGKSTLSSILSGIQSPDSGEMILRGEKYAPRSPADAREQGVSMVLQEMGVIPSLSGSVNMFLGRLDQFKSAGLLSARMIQEAAEKELARWQLGPVDLSVPAGSLSIEHRKVIELCRALSTDPDVVILDEVSQALSSNLRTRLHQIIRQLKEEGKAVVFISHDLEEVTDICDSITVLRDGEVIETRQRSEITLNELREMMVGREMSSEFGSIPLSEPGQAIALHVEDLSMLDRLHHVSFELHEGEILAVCGLSDGGIHELGKAVYGIEHGRTGKVQAVKAGVELNTPADFIRAGGAYLSKDRDSDCLMLGASVKNNVFLPSASDWKSFISPRRPRKITGDAVDAYSIKTNGQDAAVNSLSGGNKQKVNLSRWMTRDLDFVVLDCPTRGVDIGVKESIYVKLAEEKQKGLAILMICDELPEAIGLADRILVMKDGEARTIFDRSEGFSEKKLIEEMI